LLYESIYFTVELVLYFVIFVFIGSLVFFSFFFFFQAEDGIRDGHVTGVQTCALPILRLQAHRRMNGLAQNGAGIFLGDFLDFHAAGGAGHEDDAANGAIDEEAKIKFALDVEAFFDEQALDDAAGGAGLRSDQLHAENVAGDVGSFIRGAGQFYASGFAAATGVDLRFNDNDIDERSQAVGGLARFVLG